MTVRLTVHRSTHEIGGNCIEVVASDGSRLLLDIGRPLDGEGDAAGLLPATLDLGGSPAAILISHPHQTSVTQRDGMGRELVAELAERGPKVD